MSNVLLLYFFIFSLNLVEIHLQITLQQLPVKVFNWLPLTFDIHFRPILLEQPQFSRGSQIIKHSVDYTAYASTKDSRPCTPITKLDSILINLILDPLAQLSNTFKYFTPIFFLLEFCIIYQEFLEIS